jgi:cytochrome P450
MVFIVAALLHPEIQKMAQEELDAVTMRERLPTFEDRPRLPFVDAICKEVIRWRPITPLGELLPSNSPRLRGSVTTDRYTARKHKR